MRARTRAWRTIGCALALVALTIPLPLAHAAPVTHAAGDAPRSAIHATTGPSPDLFATDPDSIARGGGVCTAPTDEDCYASFTTDQTGATIVQDSTDPVGTAHTFVFTCGPAMGDLAGSGATDPGYLGTPPGCYDVSATAIDQTTGRDTNIIAASCGYNAATIHNTLFPYTDCDSTQSPLCPAAPSDATSSGDQGQITGAGDVTLCTSADAGSPLGQRMDITISPGDPGHYLLAVTGYTLVCGPGTGASADADDTPCTSKQGAMSAPDVRCPTGMAYLSGGVNGFTLTASISVDPFEVLIPILEGVCQFVLQVEQTYVVTAESIQHELTALVASGFVSPKIGEILGVLLKSAGNLRAHGNCTGAAALYRLALRLVHIWTGHGVTPAGAAPLDDALQYLITHCP
jgi:hypothetical protein